MIARGLGGLAAVAFLASAGCGSKLNVSKSFSLPGEDGPVYVLLPDIQSKDQKVNVAVTVTEGEPVDVYVIKRADYPGESEIMNEAARKKMETNGLGSARNTKSATLTCSVPANTEYRVVVLLDAKPGKQSKGTVNLTN